MGASDGSGVSLKAKNFEASASESTVDRLLDAWGTTLAWAERNPHLWIALLCLLAFWMFLNYLRSRDSKAMTIEYKERRDAARVEARQPQLPLNGREDEHA